MSDINKAEINKDNYLQKLFINEVKGSLRKASASAEEVEELRRQVAELRGYHSVDSGNYVEDNESGGQTLYINDPDTELTLMDNEFGGQTAIIN